MTQQNLVEQSISGLDHISKIVDEANEVIRKYKSGEMYAYETFSNKLNTHITGLYKSDQVVIAARSGVGKSAFTTILVKHLANKYKDLVFIYWSWEMKSYQNVIRMYSADARIPVKDLMSAKKSLNEDAFVSIVNAGNELKDIAMYFREVPVNHKQWENKVKEVALLFPGKTIVNLIDHTRLVTSITERTEEEKITNLMLAGVRVKNEVECINIFLSQLNRKIEDGERDEIGKTGILPSYIFGADSVMQCATLVLGLHRPEQYNLKTYKGLDTKNLIMTQILKQREGDLCEIAMYHNLAINKIADSMEELNPTTTYNL
jgi:replicative DNA helicase